MKRPLTTTSHPSKKFVGVCGHAERGGVEYDVAARAGVDQRGRGHRSLDFDQRLERLDFDDDGFGCIFALAAVLR